MKAPALFALNPSTGGTGTAMQAGINRFVRETVACLQRGLTLAENMLGDVKTLEGVDPVTFPADVGCSLARTPAEVRVLSATPRGGDGVRLSGGVVTWSWVEGGSGGTVRVTAIAGLSNGTTYDVVLWIGGG